MKEISRTDVMASVRENFPRNGARFIKLLWIFGEFVDRMGAAGLMHDSDPCDIDMNRLRSMPRDELESVAHDAILSALRASVSGFQVQLEVAKESIHSRRATASRGAAKKLANDKSGKHAVMKTIQAEWKRRKDAGLKFTATAFAKEMAKRHRDAVTVERIKNAQTDWNRKYHPAS